MLITQFYSWYYLVHKFCVLCILGRVRLLLSAGHSCYRPRRDGERKRKSVRGCIVDSNLSVLALVVVKKGAQVSQFCNDHTLVQFLSRFCFVLVETVFRNCYINILTLTTFPLNFMMEYVNLLVTRSYWYTGIPSHFVAICLQDIPGLTDQTIPRRLGPKRASKIRKLFNLTKADDVRNYVIKRPLPLKEGQTKPKYKKPKIQRLVTPLTLQVHAYIR